MQIIMKSYVKLSDLIIAIKNTGSNQGSYFCLYSKDSMEPLASSSVCFIDEYPTGGREERMFSQKMLSIMTWNYVIMASSLLMS